MEAESRRLTGTAFKVERAIRISIDNRACDCGIRVIGPKGLLLANGSPRSGPNKLKRLHVSTYGIFRSTGRISARSNGSHIMTDGRQSQRAEFRAPWLFADWAPSARFSARSRSWTGSVSLGRHKRRHPRVRGVQRGQTNLPLARRSLDAMSYTEPPRDVCEPRPTSAQPSYLKAFLGLLPNVSIRLPKLATSQVEAGSVHRSNTRAYASTDEWVNIHTSPSAQGTSTLAVKNHVQ